MVFLMLSYVWLQQVSHMAPKSAAPNLCVCATPSKSWLKLAKCQEHCCCCFKKIDSSERLECSENHGTSLCFFFWKTKAPRKDKGKKWSSPWISWENFQTTKTRTSRTIVARLSDSGRKWSDFTEAGGFFPFNFVEVCKTRETCMRTEVCPPFWHIGTNDTWNPEVSSSRKNERPTSFGPWAQRNGASSYHHLGGSCCWVPWMRLSISRPIQMKINTFWNVISRSITDY